MIRRVIGKWLNAGVLENGQVFHPETGSPQGGVISPLLSNIYLHEVLDLWFERDVRPRLSGRAQLVRYADDFVILFQLQADADKVMAVLPKRFGKYGLTLHPDKTRIVRFERPRGTNDDEPRHGGSRAFDFLGFTHHWGKSRKGFWVVQRKTAKSRLARALKRVAWWCDTFRHEPVLKQHRALELKLRGHYSYYGITGNARSLGKMWIATRRVWRYWLDKRGGKRRMTWTRFAQLLQRHPLPRPRIVHSALRLAANA